MHYIYMPMCAMPMPCCCHCTNARQYTCVADFWTEMELAGNPCDRQNSWYADKYFLCEIERVRDTSVSAPELSLLDPKWLSHIGAGAMPFRSRDIQFPGVWRTQPLLGAPRLLFLLVSRAPCVTSASLCLRRLRGSRALLTGLRPSPGLSWQQWRGFLHLSLLYRRWRISLQ